MKKHKTTGFWLSLTGAVILVLQVVGGALGFKINSELINNIVSSVCGVLVIVGVLIPTEVKPDLKVDIPNLNKQNNDLTNKENGVEVKSDLKVDVSGSNTQKSELSNNDLINFEDANAKELTEMQNDLIKNNKDDKLK